MRVLVVGGTEFISLHLVRGLQREGHEVAVLNRGRRPERVPAGVRAIVADRTQHTALARALAGQGFDAVYDVAYAPTTGEDVAALLDALGPGLRHAVFVSTGRVYDEPCHRILGHHVELPNTDWLARNHSCVPLYYRPEGAPKKP